MNESVLLQDVRRMDAEALTQVFDQYAPAIYKYALRHCGNAIVADQIVGDVFEKLLEKLSQGNGPGSNLRSYLFEMAYHTMVDEIRHARRTTPIEMAESARASGNSTAATVEERTLLETILRAIQNNLTEDQRQVVFLRFMEDFSVKETALIMGKKVGNVKVIQNRAVSAIRRALMHQGIDYSQMEGGTVFRQAA
jgi:RNA polymerase sigma-70 factor, ECF subfamily